MPEPMIIETKMDHGEVLVWVQVTPGLTDRMKAYLDKLIDKGRRIQHGAIRLTKAEWHNAQKMTMGCQDRKFVPKNDKTTWKPKGARRLRGGAKVLKAPGFEAEERL